MQHKSVLLKEVLEALSLKPGEIVLDGTLGSGGHAEALLQAVGPEGRLVGLDQDEEALERCRRRFEGRNNVSLIRSNFRNMDRAVKQLNLEAVDAVLLDIGISMDQLKNPERGFSFMESSLLDMRMNQSEGVSAAELLNSLSEAALTDIFHRYGEEPRSGEIAKVVVRRRQQSPIQTTEDFAQLVEEVLVPSSRFKSKSKPKHYKRHPATRVFQALRIAVNDELGALEEGLDKAHGILRKGGRLAVITFHSLEDRIAKRYFKACHVNGTAKILNKKVIRPHWSEVKANPASRSAKLRVMVKS